MSNLREEIPSEFYRGDEEKPYADNVGGLIESLQRLPPELPVRHGFDFGCNLVVYNIGEEEGAHLEIVDANN